MGVDATMLGPGSSSTPAGVANFARLVGFHSGMTHHVCSPNRLFTRSGTPPWKSLINCPLATDERVSLITAIFSDRNETDVVKRLRGDYAQSFVDVVDEVLSPLFHLRSMGSLTHPAG